jgi:hypothetical protein
MLLFEVYNSNRDAEKLTNSEIQVGRIKTNTLHSILGIFQKLKNVEFTKEIDVSKLLASIICSFFIRRATLKQIQLNLMKFFHWIYIIVLISLFFDIVRE